jgi:O-antigen/teichoic acid export membrane protein
MAFPISAASTLLRQSRWWQDTAWVAIANVSQAAGPFLALLLLGRWHGLEAAGQFAYALAVTSPLAQLLNFQLKALLLTHSSEELPLSVTASLRAIITLPATLLVLGFSIVFTPLVGIWMAARLMDSWAEIFQADLQRSGNLPRAALSQALRALGLVAAICLAPSPVLAFLLFLSFSFMLLLLFDWRLRPLPLTLHWPALSPVLSRGFVLGLVLFLQTSSGSIPRIVLENSTDAATLGLFATLSVLLQIGVILATSFGQSLLPQLPSASLGRVAIWSAIPLLGALLAFAVEQAAEPVLFDLLRLTPTQQAHDILFALGLAQFTVWPASMIGFALTAKRLYNELLIVGASILLASAASSFWFIPAWGYSGAALTLAVTGATTLIVSFILLANSAHKVQAAKI